MDNVSAACKLPWLNLRGVFGLATVFLALYERIYAESGLVPSVKEVDYLLLGNGS